jgi:hypothetical protein
MAITDWHYNNIVLFCIRMTLCGSQRRLVGAFYHIDFHHSVVMFMLSQSKRHHFAFPIRALGATRAHKPTGLH